MNRFNSPAEVLAAAEKHAANLYRRHVEQGNDLNPYCTPGARNDFDRAYANEPRHPWEGNPAWDYRWQTGQALARIVKAHAATKATGEA